MAKGTTKEARAAAGSWRRLADVRDPWRLVLVVILVLGAAFAWWNAFVLDDFFISLRYADNLVHGHGLVWNPGERVEGVTNFLWTVFLGLPLAVGWDPVRFVTVVGVLLSSLTGLVTFRMARSLLGRPWPAVGAVALLVSWYSFAAFATSGLETMLQTLLVTTMIAVVFSSFDEGRLPPAKALYLSLLAALAIMTRLDSGPSVLFVLATAMALTVKPSSLGRGPVRGSGARGDAALGPVSTADGVDGIDATGGGEAHGPSTSPLPALAALVVPFVVVVGVWLAWKLFYYGDVLPNTYYAKTGGEGLFGRGALFLWRFVQEYWLYPWLLLVPAAFVVGKRRREPKAVLALAVLSTWCVYVASVGGDFMEFRFMVPLLPVLVTMLVWCVVRVVPWRLARVALLVIPLAASLVHGLTFSYRDGIESVPALAGHLEGAGSWSAIGKKLGEDLGGSDASIAVTAAGAIPYYSGLPAVDMLGLTDTWIPVHGVPVSSQPGHSKVGPVDYLVTRGVTLVLGHPHVIATMSPPERTTFQLDELFDIGYVVLLDPSTLPATATLLEIPLGGGRGLVALYLTPHPAVDTAIATKGWRSLSLVPPS